MELHNDSAKGISKHFATENTVFRWPTEDYPMTRVAPRTRIPEHRPQNTEVVALA